MSGDGLLTGEGRLSTGVPGLDTVLFGGLIPGGVYLLQGLPGVGKTTLASQIAFEHASKGGNVVYVTLLAESHSRLLFHLRGMRFYDPAHVASRVFLLSGFADIDAGGLPALLEMLRREIRERKATLVVIDGMRAIDDTDPGERQHMKKFMHELQITTELAGCTGLVLTARAQASRPELAMMDGLLRLVYEKNGSRLLQIRKLRGSEFLSGYHPFVISEHGLTVYPRTEALLANPSPVDPCGEKKVSSGLDRLDAMLGGGLPCGTTTLVLGPSGVGKTTLGAHFLAGSSAREPGLHFGFYETPERLRSKLAPLGIDLRTLEKKGVLEFLWYPPIESILEAMAERLLEAVRARGVKRLFIDGLGGFLLRAKSPKRIVPFFDALANELRTLGVTTVYTHDAQGVPGADIFTPLTGISALLENLILLRYVEHGSELHRLISVMKVRSAAFDQTIHAFQIQSGKGIVIEKTSKEANLILSGSARARSSGLTERLTGGGKTRRRRS